MSNKSQSNESPVKKLQMTELGRIRRIILELEPLAHLYEKHRTELFKVCVELLAEYRALEKDLVDNPQRVLKLSYPYGRTFTGTFVGDRQAFLKVGPDEARWPGLRRFPR